MCFFFNRYYPEIYEVTSFITSYIHTSLLGLCVSVQLYLSLLCSDSIKDKSTLRFFFSKNSTKELLTLLTQTCHFLSLCVFLINHLFVTSSVSHVLASFLDRRVISKLLSAKQTGMKIVEDYASSWRWILM